MNKQEILKKDSDNWILIELYNDFVYIQLQDYENRRENTTVLSTYKEDFLKFLDKLGLLNEAKKEVCKELLEECKGKYTEYHKEIIEDKLKELENEKS